MKVLLFINWNKDRVSSFLYSEIWKFKENFFWEIRINEKTQYKEKEKSPKIKDVKITVTKVKARKRLLTMEQFLFGQAAQFDWEMIYNCTETV